MAEIITEARKCQGLTLDVTINITNEFKIRRWLAVQLLKLSAMILGCAIEVKHK